MYAKVFRSLWTGTLYGRSDPQHVFIFLLCHCDRKGFVDIAPQAIAGATGLPLDRVQAALLELEAPDPLSRSPALEGRRLERTDGERPWGWRIVNYEPYRARRDEDQRREEARLRMEKLREVRRGSPQVRRSSPRFAHADADAEAEAPPTASPEPSAPTKPPGGKHLAAAAAVNGSGFDEFYTAYPRKVKRPDAEKAWRQVNGDGYLVAILTGLARWRPHWEGRYTPYPATFLRGRQWQDDPASGSARVSRGRQIMEFAKVLKQKEIADEHS